MKARLLWPLVFAISMCIAACVLGAPRENRYYSTNDTSRKVSNKGSWWSRNDTTGVEARGAPVRSKRNAAGSLSAHPHVVLIRSYSGSEETHDYIASLGILITDEWVICTQSALENSGTQKLINVYYGDLSVVDEPTATAVYRASVINLPFTVHLHTDHTSGHLTNNFALIKVTSNFHSLANINGENPDFTSFNFPHIFKRVENAVGGSTLITVDNSLVMRTLTVTPQNYGSCKQSHIDNFGAGSDIFGDDIGLHCTKDLSSEDDCDALIGSTISDTSDSSYIFGLAVRVSGCTGNKPGTIFSDFIAAKDWICAKTTSKTVACDDDVETVPTVIVAEPTTAGLLTDSADTKDQPSTSDEDTDKTFTISDAVKDSPGTSNVDDSTSNSEVPPNDPTTPVKDTVEEKCNKQCTTLSCYVACARESEGSGDVALKSSIWFVSIFVGSVFIYDIV